MIKAPTYHRQKLLLFLLEHAGGALSKMDLHKLLFLYLNETGSTHYAFVPYRFGCYSFLAADDLELLHKRGWLVSEDKELKLKTPVAALPWACKSPERQAVRSWLATKTLRGQALVREVYQRYPYYAIHSEIKEQLLDSKELALVHEAGRVVSSAEQVLYTLGYEGLHFEEYVNKLIKKGVKLLCDVRRNPLSRKFGFGQRSLATLLPGFGIEYLHLPELGIEAESRKQLESKSDYDALFADYSKTLPARQAGLARIMEQFGKHKRIALTCFEREPQNCHRHCISDFLARHNQMTVRHL
jgi:hypothetical protein